MNVQPSLNFNDSITPGVITERVQVFQTILDTSKPSQIKKAIPSGLKREVSNAQKILKRKIKECKKHGLSLGVADNQKNLANVVCGFDRIVSTSTGVTVEPIGLLALSRLMKPHSVSAMTGIRHLVVAETYSRAFQKYQSEKSKKEKPAGKQQPKPVTVKPPIVKTAPAAVPPPVVKSAPQPQPASAKLPETPAVKTAPAAVERDHVVIDIEEEPKTPDRVDTGKPETSPKTGKRKKGFLRNLLSFILNLFPKLFRLLFRRKNHKNEEVN